MDTARFKYPPFWVGVDELYESVRSLDKDSMKMRGFIVVSNGKKTQKEEIRFHDILPPNTPKVRFMSDLSMD